MEIGMGIVMHLRVQRFGEHPAGALLRTCCHLKMPCAWTHSPLLLNLVAWHVAAWNTTGPTCTREC